MKNLKIKWGICVLAAMIAGTSIPPMEVSAADTSVAAPIEVKKVDGLSEDFIHGIDVSTYMSQIQSGVKYYDENGLEKNMFEIFSDAGVNYIRLRVWNCPFRVDKNGDYLYVDEEGTEYTADKVTTTKDENGFNVYTLNADGTTVYREGYGAGNCDIETATAIGKIATNYGMKVLVDFHYSDFWADPSKYRVPKAWEGMSLDEKADALYEYTWDCIDKMQSAGVDVGMVQIGNEINGGMAGEKDMGRICTLLKAGSEAVREVDEDILIAVHYANPEKGQHDDRAKDLYNAGVDYDVFASSYYPFWHGTLQNLTSVLKNIADTYGKKVMVTEVSYCYTFEDGDGHINVVRDGAAYQEYNYPISVEGQATAVRDVIEAVAAVGEMGLGTFYWEPAWIPVNNYADAKDKEAVLASNSDKWQKYGSGWASIYSGDGGDDYDPGVTADPTTHGSEWDNQALFDFNGKALPSINVYKWVYTGAEKNVMTVSKSFQDIFPDADNSAATEEGRYDYTTADFKVSGGSGVTFTSGEHSKSYEWSELLGEDYDKDAYVSFVITDIASTNTVNAAIFVKEEGSENKPEDIQKPVSYTVTFMDGTTVLSKQTVASGSAATAPAIKGKAGYTFKGWEGTFDRITADVTVKATWNKVTKPAKVKNVKVKNSAKKTMKVTFKKINGVDGYEIRYSLKSNMKKAKKVNTTTTSKKIKKLKKGKTYYIQVRAYRLDSIGKKIYSKTYSAKVKVKIKK